MRIPEGTYFLLNNALVCSASLEALRKTTLEIVDAETLRETDFKNEVDLVISFWNWIRKRSAMYLEAARALIKEEERDDEDSD